MAFDPNLPASQSLITSAELRNQFNGLKTLADEGLQSVGQDIAALQSALAERPTLDEVNTAITSQSANLPGGVDPLYLTISNPPTQAEVQAVLDRLNTLISALQR